MSGQVQAATPLIFADGTLDGSGGLQYHGQSKSSGQINFATGLAATTADSGSDSPHYNHMLWVGSSCFYILWGVPRAVSAMVAPDSAML